MSPTPAKPQTSQQAPESTSRALVPVTDVDQSAVPATETAQVGQQQAFAVGQSMLQNYMDLTRMTWGFYGSLLEDNGFQWASWWFKWPDERLAQQISAPLPPLSMALRYSESMMELSSNLQGKWVEAWRSFYTMTPAAFLPQTRPTGGTAQ